MDFGIYAGDANKTIYVRLRDSTTGLAKTGLVYNSAGAVASYTLPLAARAAITLATQTVTGAHSDGGFVEVDATNCKGLYRLDLTDAAIASGDYTVISIEFDGIIEESVLIPLHTREVNVTEWLGTAAATPTVAGVPEVDITHVGGATTNVAAMATNMDNVNTQIGTAGAGLTDLGGMSTGMKAEVNVEADTALTDYDGPTNTEMVAAFTEIKGATWASGTDTLEHIRDKQTDIETDTQDLQTQIGTAGAGLTDLGGMSTGMKAEVNVEADTALTDYDPPTNTEMVAAFTEIKGATWASGTDTLEHIRDKQTDIETDTAEIGAAGAGLTAIPATVDWLNGGRLDLILDTIAQDTTTDIPALLPAALVSGRMDANTSAVADDATAATNLAASALGIVPGACEGTPSTTVIQTDLAEATDDHYIGRIVVFTSGAAAGQASDITDYTGSTGTITVTALTTAPSAADTFVIV